MDCCTPRNPVNAIPLYAIKAGLLTVEKKGKKNVFSGRILEIEGLPNLKVEQAFELSDAAAERSAAACAVALNKEPMVEYMRSNITLMKWMIAAPPTKMDALILTEEGYYGVLGKSGARMEMPGCSLCMGNQAQIRKGSTAISTSTRNFPNRLGIDTQVYLGSAELAAMCALAGRIVTVPEYMEQIKLVNAKAGEVYRYMNFDQIPEFVEQAATVEM